MKTHVYVTRISFVDDSDFCWGVSPSQAAANRYRAGWKKHVGVVDLSTVRLPLALWSRAEDHISSCDLPGPKGSGKVFW